jgi:hypothetical protein
MGANISMDVSANIQETIIAATDTAPQQITFEDRLRQESILIPEDLADIHIEAPYINTHDPETTAADTTTADTTTADTTTADTTTADTTAESVEGGRNPRRNPRRKKQSTATATATATAAATATTTPFQTERTIEQRRAQIRPIMDKLTELQMNVSYPAIRELYKQLQLFVKTGEDAKIKIPFPEFSRRIKGELTNATYKPCWVKLEME